MTLKCRLMDDAAVHDQVAALAKEAGFSKAGIAPIPSPGGEADYPELSHFEPWIERGRAGEMQYLKRRDDANRLLRSSLRIAVPWARSVIVCAANYNPDTPKSIDPAPEETGWIARYAQTGYAPSQAAQGPGQPSDYHDVLLARLKKLEQSLQQALGPFSSRCYVDTGPLVERIYAKYAGIGWIGKNTCIIDQELGSWLFLGVILTGLELPPAEPIRVAEDRCGSCTRCIDACPTGALVAPYEMDASLCIGYLTIEKRGSIPEPLRSQMGRQVFGCDICQDVCPWNRRAPRKFGCGVGRSPGVGEPGACLACGTRCGELPQAVSAISRATRQAERPVAQRRHRHGKQRPYRLLAQVARVGCRPRPGARGSSAVGSRP